MTIIFGLRIGVPKNFFAFFLGSGIYRQAAPIPTRSDPADLEMEMFFSLPRVPREVDPLVWWKENKIIFPLMAEVARKYLSATLQC